MEAENGCRRYRCVPTKVGKASTGKDWPAREDIMTKDHQIPRIFPLEQLPEFQRFQAANPTNQIDALQTAIMYGRAIHWLSIIEILWPKFEEKDFIYVEVAYIVANDPDNKKLARAFFDQIALTIAECWKMQLRTLYPDGKWAVNVWTDPEITVEFIKNERNGQ
jgi:hypothetical protein